MMRSITSIVLLSAIAVTAFVACRKEASEEPAPPTSAVAPSAVSVQAEYYPLELTLYQLQGATLADGPYDASFGAQSIRVHALNDQFSFVVPQVPPGNYVITLPLGSAQALTLNCTVRAPLVPMPAEEYIDRIEDRLTLASAQLSVLIDSLGSTTTSSLIAHDNERLTLFLDSIVDVVTGLSEQEKLQFAEFMAANDHWMAEISTASAELLSLVNQVHRETVDRETQWHDAAIDYVTKVNVVYARAALFSAALTAMRIPIPPIQAGASVAAVLSGTAFLFAVKDALAAEGRLLDVSIIAFDQLETETLTFPPGQGILLNIVTAYRTLYNGDIALPISNFINSFVAARQKLRQWFIEAMDWLPSSAQPQFEGEDVVEQYRQDTRPVHTNWLSVAPMTSDPAVTVQKIANSDGSTSLRFSNSSDQQKTVSYTMIYSHPSFLMRSSTLTAIVGPGETSPTINAYCSFLNSQTSGGYVHCSCFDGINVVDVSYSCGDVDLALSVNRVNGIAVSATFSASLSGNYSHNTIPQDTTACPGSYGYCDDLGGLPERVVLWCGYDFSSTAISMTFSSATAFASSNGECTGVLVGSEAHISFHGRQFVLPGC